ncbi:MAG: NUDIX domain-containing protein [Streptomycetaceae bacterium]|nr:NUDIX domain-containing protein [Streptomycetaceae bacterium]
MTKRYHSAVDLFMLLQREEDGRVLLLERTGDTYASGQLCPVSGHLEEGETALAGAIREAEEEVGVRIDPADVVFAHLIHHRNPEGQGRIGIALVTHRWEGTAYNREPGKHARLVWADPAAPPPRCVPYVAALLAAIVAGAPCSLHGWPQTPQQTLLRAYAAGADHRPATPSADAGESAR